MIEVRGIVQDAVEASKLRFDGERHVLEVLVARTGEVERENSALWPARRFDLVVYLFQLGDVAPVQNYRRAMSRESERSDAADATSGPGYQDDAVFEEVGGGLVGFEIDHKLVRSER